MSRPASKLVEQPLPLDMGDRDEWELLIEASPAEFQLVNAWKRLYNDWLDWYGKFRELERKLMYACGADSRPVKVGPQVLRGHRRVVCELLSGGDELAGILEKVNQLAEPEERTEADAYRIRIGTMLESLRESLEIWHPANSPRPEVVHALRNAFQNPNAADRRGD